MPKQGVPLTTYIAPADLARLRELAKASDRSLAGEVRHAIRLYLNGCAK